MMMQHGPEKRQHPRADATLVVSYRLWDAAGGYDISQSKNVSQGGMLLTTNEAYEAGTTLALTIRLPFTPQAIEVAGEVVGSEEIVRQLIYDTRVHFYDVAPDASRRLGDFVDEARG